jgi:hypothetical protein
MAPKAHTSSMVIDARADTPRGVALDTDLIARCAKYRWSASPDADTQMWLLICDGITDELSNRQMAELLFAVRERRQGIA